MNDMSGISVTIHGPTGEDVRARMQELLGVAGNEPVRAPYTPAPAPAPVQQEATTGRKPRGGKKGTTEPIGEAAQISTGENRTGPEDSAETQQEDAADEAAETATATTKTLTHDDVRGALGTYVKKFGMPAAQEDGPAMLKKAFGDKVDKISLIPDDQADLAKAIAGVAEMLEKNPFKRTAIV